MQEEIKDLKPIRSALSWLLSQTGATIIQLLVLAALGVLWRLIGGSPWPYIVCSILVVLSFTISILAWHRMSKQIARTRDEIVQARDEVARVHDEVVQARDEVARVHDEIARVRDQSNFSRDLVSIFAKLVELDDSVLNMLPSLPSAQDRVTGVKNVLCEILRDCSKVIGPELSRAWIMQPNGDEYLEPWVSYQMPPETLNRTRFFIGNDPLRLRGTAGEAFVTQEIIVVHMICNAGKLESDRHGYIEFDSKRPHPPYRSFVAVPILGESVGPPLAVLCLDSMNQTLFDAEGMKELLAAMSRRIAATILLYQAIECRG